MMFLIENIFVVQPNPYLMWTKYNTDILCRNKLFLPPESIKQLSQSFPFVFLCTFSVSNSELLIPVKDSLCNKYNHKILSFVNALYKLKQETQQRNLYLNQQLNMMDMDELHDALVGHYSLGALMDPG